MPPPAAAVPRARAHNRQASSITSIADITARSRAHARRMSTSATPQSAVAAAVLAEPRAVQALRRPKLYLGALVVGVFLTGLAASLVFGSSLDTSALSPSPSRTYLATKSNVLNQWFVKRCWGWTALFFLLHLATSPPSPASKHEPAFPSALDAVFPADLAAAPPSSSPPRRLLARLAAPLPAPRQTRRQRLAAFVLSTTLWVVFAAWFFGAGLGDRVIALSGGRCAVALPHAVPPAALDALLPDAGQLVSGPGGALYLPLPAAVCHARAPLTPDSHPDLFALFADPAEPAAPAAPAAAAAVSRLTARWTGGFDISGHAFLLTLAALVLAHELAPSWAALIAPARAPAPARATRDAPLRRALHAFATWGGTALVGLWVFMVAVTAVFFHNPPEKLAGLALGLAASTLVDLLTPRTLAAPVIEFMPPQPAAPPAPAPARAPSTSARRARPSPELASPVEDDENAARRGMLDEDARAGA